MSEISPSEYYCETCESHMNTLEMWDMHVTGKRHLKNLRKVDVELPQVKSVVKDQPSSIQSDVDAIEYPVIGLSHVVEMISFRSRREPTFSCKLCKIQGDKYLILSHIVTTMHRMNHMKKADPENYRLIENLKLVSFARDALVREKAELLEQKQGRGEIEVRKESRDQETHDEEKLDLFKETIKEMCFDVLFEQSKKRKRRHESVEKQTRNDSSRQRESRRDGRFSRLSSGRRYSNATSPPRKRARLDDEANENRREERCSRQSSKSSGRRHSDVTPPKSSGRRYSDVTPPKSFGRRHSDVTPSKSSGRRHSDVTPPTTEKKTRPSDDEAVNNDVVHRGREGRNRGQSSKSSSRHHSDVTPPKTDEKKKSHSNGETVKSVVVHRDKDASPGQKRLVGSADPKDLGKRPIEEKIRLLEKLSAVEITSKTEATMVSHAISVLRDCVMNFKTRNLPTDLRAKILCHVLDPSGQMDFSFIDKI